MGGSEAAEDVEPSANKQTKCDTHLEVKSDFLGFVNLKDFESVCRDDGLKGGGKGIPHRSGEMDTRCKQSGCECQFIRHITDQGSAMVFRPHVL